MTERQILHDAKEELNRFPYSVRSDTENNNPDWEWILHRGTEAQIHMHAYSFSGSKQRTVKDCTNLLMRKKSLSKDDTRGKEPNDKQSSVENSYMRVPKLWDPEPF